MFSAGEKHFFTAQNLKDSFWRNLKQYTDSKSCKNYFNSLAVIKIPKMFLYLMKNKKLWKRNSNFGTL